MIGQAILKSAAFTTNGMILQLLQESSSSSTSTTIAASTSSDTQSLLIAACLSGFLTSFLVVPIERIKVMMQSQLKNPSNDNIQQQPFAPELYDHHNHLDPAYVMMYQSNNNNVGRMIEQPSEMVAATTTTTATTYSSDSFLKKYPITSTSLSATVASTAVTASTTRSTTTSRNHNNGAMVYRNEYECYQAVLQKDGVYGLLFRGLVPTICREVPRYGIYFVLYGMLVNPQYNVLEPYMGAQLSPLFYGALAGCCSWLPVYPTDVVKTMIQNTEGGHDSENSSDTKNPNNPWWIGKELYDTGGLGAFYGGLTPKLLRAALMNAVTFFTYDTVVDLLSASSQ